MKWYLIVLNCTSIISCMSLQRSESSGYSQNANIDKSINEQININSGLNYRDVRKKFTFSNSTEITNKSDDEKNQNLKNLERKLDTVREKEQYSRILPWFNNIEEQIEFLQLSGIESRQKWINKTKILSRNNSNSQEVRDLIEAQDISLGMPQEAVKKSWGDPITIEGSGNSLYKNERWRYIKYVPTPNGHRQEKRWVYFESGRVVGWETE